MGADFGGATKETVRRFVHNLRGAATPEARAIIETNLGEEAQVDQRQASLR